VNFIQTRKRNYRIVRGEKKKKKKDFGGKGKGRVQKGTPRLKRRRRWKKEEKKGVECLRKQASKKRKR